MPGILVRSNRQADRARQLALPLGAGKRSSTAKVRAWRKRNPERAAVIGRAQARRDGRLRTLRKYGITQLEYDELLAAQGGVCAICLKPPPTTGRTRYLAIDHDHKLAKSQGVRASVRGLICSYPCNYVLVRSHFGPAVLHRAGSYLEAPPARKVIQCDPTNA